MIRRWLSRTLVSLSILGLFSACPGVSWADAISQTVGIAAKDTDAITWRHLLSPRFSQFSAGFYPTAPAQNYLATLSLVTGCNGANCQNLWPIAALDPDSDLILTGNNSLLTIAHLYGFDGTNLAWSRLRIRNPLTSSGVQDGLGVSPMLRSGFGPNDLSLADQITQATTTGIQNIVPYGVSTGGALNRMYQAGFIGVTPNTCAGCQIATPYVLVDPVTPAFRAWSGAPVQGSGTLTNSQTVSAADTAVSVTLAATANSRSHIYKVTGRCSAGTSTMSITHGGTTVWSTAATEVGVVNFREEWATGLTGPVNSAAVMTLATCGAGNTGTLMVQSDIF